jgi:hypothetical protein
MERGTRQRARADADRLAEAVWGTLYSPNESDSNFEPANVVDGLFHVARAVERLASAVARVADTTAVAEGGKEVRP